MSRVILVGEDNPYGADPHYALYPAPDGCSGHRLCKLVFGLDRAEYLRRFDRVNLCDGKWSMVSAHERACKIWSEAVALGRPAVVLLGRKVAKAFTAAGRQVEPAFTISGIETGAVTKCVYLPHPSGPESRLGGRGGVRSGEASATRGRGDRVRLRLDSDC